MEAFDRWIKVEDGLPEIATNVIACTDDDVILMGKLFENGWALYYADGQCMAEPLHKVSHWQPLPDPPKAV